MHVALTGKEIDTWTGVEHEGKPVVHRELRIWGFEFINPGQHVQGKIYEFDTQEQFEGLEVDDICYLVVADIDDFRPEDEVLSQYVYILDVFTDEEEAEAFRDEYLRAHRYGNPTFDWHGQTYQHICFLDGVKFGGLRVQPIEYDGDSRD